MVYLHDVICDGRDKKNIQTAAETLLKGDVVAFVTETVYGLGALASNTKALERIFEIKGRPQTDPLIIHISSREELMGLVKEIPPVAETLMKRFWPGPLTLIFDKKDTVSDLITSGLKTVAVRMPAHPVARDLLKEVGQPIAAPSANKFQSISPTSAAAVEAELGESILILDGGPSDIGMESTVISVTGEPTVLRFGAVTLEQLTESLEDLPKVAREVGHEMAAQVAPGLLAFHYAPKTKLRFLDGIDQLNEVKDLERIGSYLLVFSNKERDFAIKKNFGRVKVLSPNGDLKEAAKSFYSALREMDQMRPQIILAVKVPDRGLGKAINDRLRKAAHQ